jgi:hypothetical protein
MTDNGICDWCWDKAEEIEQLRAIFYAALKNVLRGDDEARNEIERLRARIDAALALHWEESTVTGIPAGFCASCRKSWPCPTVKALGGEK